jgi:hypothetical protein
MTWVNGLTLDEVNGLVADSYPFEAKTFRAFMLIMARLRVYGSLPVDDRSMASIAGCTRHWWANRAWPALRELFEVTEEGRLYHPGVRSMREQPTPGEDDAERAARAARNQANAVAGWEKRRAAMHLVPSHAVASTSHAVASTSHAVASRSHAKTDASSDTFASDPHAGTAPVASDVASPVASGSHDVASDSRALSLQRDSLDERDKIQRDSLGERESARASADAAAPATSDATGDATDATSHATRRPPPRATLRPEGRRPPPAIGPIPPDWTPSEANLAFGKSRGYDEQQLSEIVGNYRDYRQGHGDLRADFDADFRAWLRREAPPPARAQGHLTMPIPGGVPAGPPPVAFDRATATPGQIELADRWAKVRMALQQEVGDAEFRNWLRPMTLVDFVGDEVIISLPSGFVRDWVRDHHGARLSALWQETDPGVRRIDFQVSGERRSATS